jgi:hypothetical protein
MPIANIYPAVLWANTRADSSVTIARSGGASWAFAEVQLAWVSGDATAAAWISGMRIQESDGLKSSPISPDPGGAPIGTWIKNCVSVTFSLRAVGGYAAANAKLSPWE